MERCRVVFCIEDQLFHYGIDILMSHIKEYYLSRRVIPIQEDFLLPIINEGSEYYMLGGFTGWQIVWNGEEVRDRKRLLHGSYFHFVSDHMCYSVLILDEGKNLLATNKVKLSCGQNIFIGRAPESNIILDINQNVSRKHAAIRCDENGNGYMEDISRKTGTFLNGKRTVSAKLAVGDVIEIMGVGICYMGGYLVIPQNVPIHGLEKLEYFEVEEPIEHKNVQEFFRTPRIFKSLEKDRIVIDVPPQMQRQKQIPFILTAGPSFTMAMAMMASFGVTVFRAVNGGNIGTVITGGGMVVSMLLGALMWPSLLRNYHKRMAEAEEAYRTQKYRRYLMEKEKEIKTKYERNIRIWNENYQPSMERIAEIIRERKINLWERTAEDCDFLEIRLGIGSKKFEAEICHPEKKFQLYDDVLIEEAIALGNKYKTLTHVPLTLPLLEKRTVGLFGVKSEIENMLRCIVFYIAALHSPEDVKICMVCNELQMRDMKWMKELPHCWNASRTVRYLACGVSETYSLFNDLDEMLLEREEILEKNEMRLPHLVVIVLDTVMVEDTPFYRYLIDNGNRVGVSAVFAAEQFYNIPKESSAIIQTDRKVRGVYIKNENDNRFLPFETDRLSLEEAEKLSHNLADIPVKTEKSTLSIPERIGFLDMYKVGKLEDIHITQRWKNNSSDRSLAVPIGIKAGGELFFLDIHEKYHGCHGLVAGMTGSGKSEFLQAYIVSAILNYSPNELAFVLVDFKGGDMARPFLNMPHLAATISNLSGNILYRALISLEAEIKARQNRFNESAAALGVDKIDINSYQKYFKEGRLAVPLPHLVIVIDEFAQLKSQQPEFMARLIDIAQVGRSLGLHLILATQKPSGVVDGQIWSNSRFKICLKVLDKQDSKEMIGRVDAAMIKFPGRAYVQVGYDEIYEQIQSGYSGADYVPKEVYTEEDSVTVRMIDTTASAVRTAKNTSAASKTGKTQLEEAVRLVIETAKNSNLNVKPLWLDLLPEELYLRECIGGFAESIDEAKWDLDQDISCICGKIDLIAAQRQIPYEISFVTSGHLAIYGASGSGKTTLIQTIVFSLAQKYSPEMLNIFALDFGGKNLKNLSLLPHCIDTSDADEEEKAASILAQVLACMEQRKELFARNNCATYESYLSATGKKLPAVLLILDHYASFRENMFANEDDMIRIAGNAKTYGIYLIITGNSRNAIYYKVSDHISKEIVLWMNDRMHYRDILGVSVPFEPEHARGRGLAVHDGTAVELQSALSVGGENEAVRMGRIRQIYELCAESYRGEDPRLWYGVSEPEESDETPVFSRKPPAVLHEKKKMAVSVLPSVQDDGHTIVFGTSKISGELQGFSLSQMHCVFIGVSGGVYPDKFVAQLQLLDHAKVFRAFPNGSIADGQKLAGCEEEIHDMVEHLEGAVKERTLEKIFVVLEDFCKFYDAISDADLRRLNRIIEQSSGLGIYFITLDDVKRMRPYCDTALYRNLVKTEQGMILGGNIDNETASRLHPALLSIPMAERMRSMQKNQAFLYDKDRYSVILLE